MGIASAGSTPTTAIITVHDKYLLDLVREALATKNLVLNATTTTASGATFYNVGPSDAILAEAAARTAAAGND